MACQKWPRLQFLLSQTVPVEKGSFQEGKRLPRELLPDETQTAPPEAFTSGSDCVQAGFRIVRGNYKAIYHSWAGNGNTPLSGHERLPWEPGLGNSSGFKLGVSGTRILIEDDGVTITSDHEADFCGMTFPREELNCANDLLTQTVSVTLHYATDQQKNPPPVPTATAATTKVGQESEEKTHFPCHGWCSLTRGCGRHGWTPARPPVPPRENRTAGMDGCNPCAGGVLHWSK